MTVKIDKALLRASNNRALTQGLFLEHKWDGDTAVFTLDAEDKVYNGKTFYSLKKLYLEHEDVVEYDFATTYLLGWAHWQRICKNKQFTKIVDEWRAELELRLRSQGVKGVLELTATGNFQACKWIADKGWDKKAVGRPTKDSLVSEEDFEKAMMEEYSADILRIHNN